MLLLLLYLLITVAFLSFASSLTFFYLNLQESMFETNLFYNTTFDLERKYFEYATPASFVYGVIWPIIYITNSIGLLYMLVGAFIPPRMSPVKVTPSLTPPFFLLFYSFAFATTIGWIFAYDSEVLPLALAFLLLGAIFAMIAVGISAKRIQDNLFTLEIKGKVMMWMIRVLVQNPLCVFATWMVVASALTMTDVILYHDSFYNIDPNPRGLIATLQDGSCIGLGVLFGIGIIWFILENFVWQRYCCYIFTVYPVLIFAMVGVIHNINNNFHENINLNSVLILASVELSFYVMALLLHIGHVAYRIRTSESS